MPSFGWFLIGGMVVTLLWILLLSLAKAASYYPKGPLPPEEVERMQKTGVLCPAILSRCECDKPIGHEGPHECQCGGSWGDDGEIYQFPQRIIWPRITIRGGNTPQGEGKR